MSTRTRTIERVGKSIPQPKSHDDYEGICEGLAVVLATVSQHRYGLVHRAESVEAAATNAIEAVRKTLQSEVN